MKPSRVVTLLGFCCLLFLLSTAPRAAAATCIANGTFCCTCNQGGNLCTLAFNHQAGASWECIQIRADCEEYGVCIGNQCGTMKYHLPSLQTLRAYPWITQGDLSPILKESRVPESQSMLENLQKGQLIYGVPEHVTVNRVIQPKGWIDGLPERHIAAVVDSKDDHTVTVKFYVDDGVWRHVNDQIKAGAQPVEMITFTPTTWTLATGDGAELARGELEKYRR